ncbi:hypothetical protein [uncultured Dysosmobacter sp.]|uniref:hypothetical protein n=1 Tax=uncultured Dysosmobacter sp. TaxID=2591384 RepID=UPI00261582A8|nr:hypothetical protein [uncultured Dysosmobacter sp.]
MTAEELTRQQFEQRLEQYPGVSFDLSDTTRYDNLPAKALAMLCRLKDKSNDLYLKRVAAAQEVIDQLARIVGINMENSGLWLYTLDYDGSSYIARKLEEYISRAGDKAKLKRRLDELENENRVLRSLLQK